MTLTPQLICVQAHAHANEKLNIRIDPALSASIIGQWLADEQLDIWCTDVYNGDWYLCQSPTISGRCGWSHKDYITIEKELWQITN